MRRWAISGTVIGLIPGAVLGIISNRLGGDSVRVMGASPGMASHEVPLPLTDTLPLAIVFGGFIGLAAGVASFILWSRLTGGQR